jgi:hypothetical protein
MLLPMMEMALEYVVNPLTPVNNALCKLIIAPSAFVDVKTT